MKGLFILHKYKITFKHYGEKFYLVPFGDVHRFAKNCDEQKWKAFCDRQRKEKNTFYLGMGDYDDLMSTSERKSFVNAGFHETTEQSLEKLYDERTTKFANEISFMKGKLIGLIEGNHFGEYTNYACTTTQKLAQIMKCKYLGCTTLIRLSFQYAKSNCHHCIDIFAHHGRGSGRTVGSSFNGVEQMQKVAEADIFLMGHDHKRGAIPMSRLKLVSGQKLKLANRKIFLCRTGSFLKGYVPNEKSYVSKALLPPAELGAIKIELTPKREIKDKQEDRFIDINVRI